MTESDAPSRPDRLVAMIPFATTLGIELQTATPAETTGSLAWAPERCTAGGVLHGGAVMSLADTIGAICAFLNLPEGATTATVDSTTRLYLPSERGPCTRGLDRPMSAAPSSWWPPTSRTTSNGWWPKPAKPKR